MAKYIKKLIAYINCFPIRRKFLFCFFLLIFIPLFVLTILLYHDVATSYEDSIKFSAVQSFDQAHTLLRYRLETMLNASQIICTDEIVQQILMRDQSREDICLQTGDFVLLDDLLYRMRNTSDIHRVALYIPDWMVFSSQGVDFMGIDEFKKSKEYEKLINSREIAIMLPVETIRGRIPADGDQDVISVLRKIKNLQNLEQVIGVVKVSIPASDMHDILMRANSTREGLVFLVNDDNALIADSIDTENLLRENEDVLHTLTQGNYNWDFVLLGDDSYMVKTYLVDNTDWRLVSAVPYSEIYKQSNRIRNLMFILIVFVGGIAYALAVLFSHSITKRLSQLVRGMTAIQSGDLNFHLYPNHGDEIGQLFIDFNTMVERIKELMEEKYKAGLEIRTSELRVLQAQINPHLLYNTLEMIQWMGLDYNVPKISEIALALSQFYRLSLSDGNDKILLRDELEHVRMYVLIQNKRFLDRIRMTEKIPPDLLDRFVPKIILQPLVENAIIHGMCGIGEDEYLTIRIEGRIDGERIYITVSDDGAGMTEEKMKTLLDGLRSNACDGYGVYNIQQRLQLSYGEEFGLSFCAVPEHGVSVNIILPLDG